MPEFMRKHSMLTVAQTTQNIWNFMVRKSSLPEIAALAIIWEISDSNLETGRYGPKSGVSQIIRESWQHWYSAIKVTDNGQKSKQPKNLMAKYWPPKDPMSNFCALKILDNLKGKVNTCWRLFIIPSEFIFSSWTMWLAYMQGACTLSVSRL